MTISSTTRKAGPFPGNGVTVALPFTFKVFTAADVLAVQAVTATGVETTLALGTDYTVSLNADQDTTPGGTLTLVTAHATGTSVTLTTQIENTQGTDLTNLGGFYPKVINDALDRATIQIQQLAEKLSRVLTFGISSGASGTLPNPSPLSMLGWNAAGTALQNFAGGASAAVSSFMATVVAAVDAVAAQTALGATAVGRALFGAADAAAARTAIGAQATIGYTPADAATAALDSAVVKLTGDQSIGGVKTFTSQPVLPQAPVLGTAVATTSGTTINLAGIPAWANEVTLLWAGVSTSGSAYPLVRLNGQSTGYNAGSSVGTTYSAFSDGFGFSGSLGSNSISGAIVFKRQSGNTWCGQGSVQAGGITWSISGSVALSAALSSIALTTVGSTDTYDAGSVSIYYKA